MHSMTNLAVVNTSYLKFSSNARGIMDSDRECTAAAIAIAVICKKRRRRIKKKCRQKRFDWVKGWLTKRNELGFERTLLREFRSKNEDEYRKFLKAPYDSSYFLTMHLPCTTNNDVNDIRWV